MYGGNERKMGGMGLADSIINLQYIKITINVARYFLLIVHDLFMKYYFSCGEVWDTTGTQSKHHLTHTRMPQHASFFSNSQYDGRNPQDFPYTNDAPHSAIPGPTFLSPFVDATVARTALR